MGGQIDRLPTPRLHGFNCGLSQIGLQTVSSAAQPVSVVVPVYRAATTLRRALESIASQTALPTEVILVDDASDDGTAEHLTILARQSWPFVVRTLRLPVNAGPGSARNAGWEAVAAVSEWVAFLDSDDEWLSGKLAQQLAWMGAHPEFVWSAHRCDWTGVFIATEDQGHTELTQSRLLYRNVVATPTVLVRRDAVPRFREGWRQCEDFMLWQDLLAAEQRGALLHATLARLGRRPASAGGMTGNLTAMHGGEMRALATMHAEGRLSLAEFLGWSCWIKAKYLRRRLWQRFDGAVRKAAPSVR